MSEVKEKGMMSVDANSLTAGEIETLLYRFLRNDREDESAKILAGALCNFCNLSGSTKALVNESMRDHRYLLNEKMFFIFGMIAAAAKAYKDGWVDDRNKYSFKLAAEIFDSIQCDTCYTDDRNCIDCEYHKLRLGCR